MPRAARYMISPWIKVAYTAFLCVFVPVHWVINGPAHFLWGSDIALLVAGIALWIESRFLASTMAVAVLLPELAWNADFFLRLVAGRDLVGLDATGYMWDAGVAPVVRVLSLFHVFLPALLVWLVWRLGYDRRALVAQTLLAWVVLPLSYWLTDPVDNINWVFGPGAHVATAPAGPGYLAALMLLFPPIVYLPTHLLLRRLFGRGQRVV